MGNRTTKGGEIAEDETNRTLPIVPRSWWSRACLIVPALRAKDGKVIVIAVGPSEEKPANRDSVALRRYLEAGRGMPQASANAPERRKKR
jgi:hypothetical protein